MKSNENMSADVGLSAMRVYKHYKKHYDDICNLFDASGLQAASAVSAASNQLPDNLELLIASADQSLEQLKQHINSVDELATIPPKELPKSKPEFCTALVNYRKELDILFSAVQSIKAEAPKPKRKSKGKARTKRL